MTNLIKTQGLSGSWPTGTTLCTELSTEFVDKIKAGKRLKVLSNFNHKTL